MIFKKNNSIPTSTTTMKSILVLATLVAGSMAIEQSFLEAARAKVKKRVEQCVEEEKASQSDLDQLMKLTVPDSKEGKCVIFCAHKKFDIQREDGSIDDEGILSTFNVLKDVDEDYYNKWMHIYNTCKTTPADSDPCIYAAALFQCIIKDAQEEGIHDLIIE